MYPYLKLLNNCSPLIQGLSALVIMFLTLFYVLYTRRLLRESSKTNRLSSDPFLQVMIDGIAADAALERKSLMVDLSIRNLGGSPALNVRIDAVIDCVEFVNKDGQRVPRGYFPSLDKTQAMIPAIAPGETCAPEVGNRPYFEEDAAHHVQDAWLVYDRSKNQQRSPCCLRLILYYSNSVGELYETTYSSLLLPELSTTESELGKDQLAEIEQQGYNTVRMSEKQMFSRIETRRRV